MSNYFKTNCMLRNECKNRDSFTCYLCTRSKLKRSDKFEPWSHTENGKFSIRGIFLQDK